MIDVQLFLAIRFFIWNLSASWLHSDLNS